MLDKLAKRWPGGKAGLGFTAVLVVFSLGLLAVVGIDRSSNEGKNELSLSGLVADPFDKEVHVLTPLEDMREQFKARYKIEPKKQRDPEVAGTILMLRAVSELDPELHATAIDDAVRHLRRNPQVLDKVYRIVDNYADNNPHLADKVKDVERAVKAKLAAKPKRKLEWLDF